MASSSKSRWADTEDDREFAVQKQKAKEERRRRKLAEKADKTGPNPKQSDESGATVSGHGDDNLEEPRVKRRRFTPGPEAEAPARALLRFHAEPWKHCSLVDKYDKLNDIEEGTYGWVARGRELKTGKIVALKRLKLEARDRSGLPVTGLREIQILKDCSHRNIVGLEEVVVGNHAERPGNSVFLVLEFVEHDLKSVLEDMPEPFLPSEVKRLLLQLGSGIEYLHENWILHRDLKTSNLLLNNRGQLKIADFGMARYVGDPAPGLTQLVVTLWYRSPELLLGAKTYNWSVDMWSVGCIFAELLTREPPLQGANEVDQVTKIFELCGVPSETTWPGFRQLPNARTLRLPKSTVAAGSVVRSRFPLLTTAGCELMNSLLSLDPSGRPSATDMLRHEYFRQDPRPKPESMLPTFPSKAGQEKRRHHEPHAPERGEAVQLRDVDFSGIFQSTEREQRGAGFTLRMV